MNEENSIVSGAASTDVGATYSDDEFVGGFKEALGLEPENEPQETTASGDSDEVSEGTPEGFVEDESEKTEEAPAGTADEDSGNGEQENAVSEMVDFVESGRKFSAPREAVETFAKAVGRSPENLIDVYQKGCNYDKLKGRFDEAKKSDEIFEKIAAIRKISAEQLKAEIIATVERVPIEEMTRNIQRENPGMKKELAEELARFRIGQQPKAEVADNEETGRFDEIEGRLREIDIFEANHPEVGKLDNAIIEAWEKTGIPLELAYSSFIEHEESVRLKEENERLKKEMTVKGQKNYAREHSPGSMATAAGKPVVDEFVAGLFKTY